MSCRPECHLQSTHLDLAFLVPSQASVAPCLPRSVARQPSPASAAETPPRPRPRPAHAVTQQANSASHPQWDAKRVPAKMR